MKINEAEQAKTSKIKMRAPKKPGQKTRYTTIAQDKRAEYEKKGYTYVGLSDKPLDGTEKTKDTKKTRKTKSTEKPLSVSTIESTNMRELSLVNIYDKLLAEARKRKRKLKEKKKILFDADDEGRRFCENCGQFHDPIDECENGMYEQSMTSAMAGYNAPFGGAKKKRRRRKKK